ncbi:MAG TPA: hypothetical protein ENJ28_09630, partial [Gammaproteobacteria bacterium]|nr:hypothetical protein [Gammaproteobacteria bacterium]
MKLIVVSIIPIELFTTTRAQLAEKYLLDQNCLYDTDTNVSTIFKEISGSASRFYSVSSLIGDDMYVVFYESSICLYLERSIENWILDRKSIEKELKTRNAYHKGVISNSDNSAAKWLVDNLRLILPESEYGQVNINYVFSFYVVDGLNKDQQKSETLKILAEPSIIDLDDMLSTECNQDVKISKDINYEYLGMLSDVDISSHATTYITWATIVSSSEDSYWANKTKSLLAALECRLQIVWNRCYSVSKFIDDVFDRRDKPKDIEELYWSFVKTLDDARSVLSSTYSSRADRLFSEMISTSKISGEIDRLEQKINLLEKYIEQHNLKL